VRRRLLTDRPTTAQLFISHVQLAQPPAAYTLCSLLQQASLFAGRPSLTAVGLSAVTAVAFPILLHLH